MVRLVELYQELAAHPLRDDSKVAWQLGMKLRLRLVDVRERLEKRGGAATRTAKASGGRQTDIAPVDPDQDSPAILRPDQDGAARFAPQTQVLTQRLPPPAAPPAGRVAPAAAPQPAAGPIVDYGPQLVELIEATISPGTWNINGGPGAIVYYQPLRVLVVSAPDDVQNQIGGVVGRLRATRP